MNDTKWQLNGEFTGERELVVSDGYEESWLAVRAWNKQGLAQILIGENTDDMGRFYAYTSQVMMTRDDLERFIKACQKVLEMTPAEVK